MKFNLVWCMFCFLVSFAKAAQTDVQQFCSYKEFALASVAFLLAENALDYQKHSRVHSSLAGSERVGSMSPFAGIAKEKNEERRSFVVGYLHHFCKRLNLVIKSPIDSMSRQTFFTLGCCWAAVQSSLFFYHERSPRISNSLRVTTSIPLGTLEYLKKEREQPCSNDVFMQLQKDIINQEIAASRSSTIEKSYYCLDGPPGVGKTFFIQDLARRMGYHCETIACGTLGRDKEGIDFKLLGVGQQYQGKKLGRIAQGLESMKEQGKKGLIVLLDELEKADALDVFLALLDPEQNRSIHENYLNQNIDLSSVIFVATVNSKEDLHRKSEALFSRLTFVDIPPFDQDQKSNFLRALWDKPDFLDPAFKAAHDKEALIKSIVDFSEAQLDLHGQKKEKGVREIKRRLKEKEKTWLAEG